VWSLDPVCGNTYWLDICTSPELLIFAFFMMTDPRTAPPNSRWRLVYGAATALLATSLISFQPTEFGIKVALLASLTMVCPVVPLIEVAGSWRSAFQRLFSAAGEAMMEPAVAAAILITAAVPVGVVQLANNHLLIDIERGLPPPGTPSQ
jgi:hypothetical protein